MEVDFKVGDLCAIIFLMANEILDYFLLLWSEDPGKLQRFYTRVLGLKLISKLELPDDYGYALGTKEGGKIWIGRHSDAIGRNKDKFRFILNFYVDDVMAWWRKLSKRKDIEIIAEPFVTPPTRKAVQKRFCFTFLDPDGNCLQLMTAKKG